MTAVLSAWRTSASAGRYRLAVRVKAEEDGEYIAPRVLVYECGKVTHAGCMNMVTEGGNRSGTLQ